MPCFAMSLQSVEWEGDCLMGASLSALKLLGDDFGYVLLGTDNEAVNAFFLRKDVYAKEVGAHPPPTRMRRGPGDLPGDATGRPVPHPAADRKRH